MKKAALTTIGRDAAKNSLHLLLLFYESSLAPPCHDNDDAAMEV
jgi:hypothetical protein